MKNVTYVSKVSNLHKTEAASALKEPIWMRTLVYVLMVVLLGITPNRWQDSALNVDMDVLIVILNRINGVLSQFVRNAKMTFICTMDNVLLPVKEVSSPIKKLDNVFNARWIVLSVIPNKFVSNALDLFSYFWTECASKNVLTTFTPIGTWEDVWCVMICAKLAKTNL